MLNTKSPQQNLNDHNEMNKEKTKCVTMNISTMKLVYFTILVDVNVDNNNDDDCRFIEPVKDSLLEK
ncbi:hypothetical protein DERP_008543 [Dermatophagoides pteronyssinus]|uniref:Uncharacterized protein n=1 Tax=Dermatophagoides pteronyssinus TaxID=6956 RepID=A0ABQ8IWN4_DERPT|nr:hypothetical protein DERP_008543 [Dermatophagoides pteronyssinus]